VTDAHVCEPLAVLDNAVVVTQTCNHSIITIPPGYPATLLYFL